MAPGFLMLWWMRFFDMVVFFSVAQWCELAAIADYLPRFDISNSFPIISTSPVSMTKNQYFQFAVLRFAKWNTSHKVFFAASAYAVTASKQMCSITNNGCWCRFGVPDGSGFLYAVVDSFF